MRTPETTFTRLKWAAILAPVFFMGVLAYTSYVLYPFRDSWQAWSLTVSVLLVAAVTFYAAVFAFIGHVQEGLARNRELTALRNAGLDIASELSLEAVLQKIVDLSCNLIEAKYGALCVVDESGRIESFMTAGVSPAERSRIGDPPQGHGLLGIPLREGQRLRLEDIRKDSRSYGLPPHHPSMRSLLAVPIICRTPFRGNLYLSEKFDGSSFSQEDEETLVRFAAQAAVAVDNAHLHRKAQDLAVAEERLRIAREMHDGVAQVLGYCNTKLQAIKEFLHSDRTTEAEEQLDELAKTTRQVYADVREGILGLRTSIGPDHSFGEALRQYLEQWQDQSGIRGELQLEDRLALEPAIELQLMRIVQEALANVRKHARAQHATVDFKHANGALVVKVEDDGIGFNPEARGRSGFPRFGLTTMRERAEAIGGTMEVRSRPGEGTRIRVELPVRGPGPK